MVLFGNHKDIGAAVKLPINEAVPAISVSPIVLPSPDRPTDLQLRVSAPTKGDKLPIILLSHGHGPSGWLSSLEGYAPLTEFWASHGFVVLNPTHLSSRSLGIEQAPEGSEMYWQSRAHDMVQILDQLDAIEEAVPFLHGRLDKSKLAIVGHSFGGWTTSMLLGASNTDPRTGATVRVHEPRFKAGVILCGTGNGGDSLSDNARKLLPWYGSDFGTMTTPALVVCGDEDVSPHLTKRDATWHADPYTQSPGQKDLLWIKGAQHGLGGVSGFDAKETQDEGVERLNAVQRLTWAYLRSQLYEGDRSWEQALEALRGLEMGSAESRAA